MVKGLDATRRLGLDAYGHDVVGKDSRMSTWINVTRCARYSTLPQGMVVLQDEAAVVHASVSRGLEGLEGTCRGASGLKEVPNSRGVARPADRERLQS